MRDLSIDKLKPNRYNPNELTDDDFNGLKESIETAGFIPSNPLLVRPIEDGLYEIVDGEHRWKACMELGFLEIPCEVREMPDLEAHRLCVILNKDRGELDYFKLSKLFNEDYDKYSREGKNQEWLGESYGFAQPTIARILPIYPRLNESINLLIDLSNRDLMGLAGIRNDRFRQAWVLSYTKGMRYVALQDVASVCNKISGYIEEVTADIELRKRCFDKLVVRNLIFEKNSDDLKKMIDTIVGIHVDKEETDAAEGHDGGDSCSAPPRPTEQSQQGEAVGEAASEIAASTITESTQPTSEKIDAEKPIRKDDDVPSDTPINKLEGTLCPCKCGYGYDSSLKSWISPSDITTYRELASPDRKPVVLLYFWNERCSACKMQAPINESVEKEIGDKVLFLKIDTDKNPWLSREFDVRAIPSLVIIQGKSVFTRYVGVTRSHDLIAALNGALNGL